MLKNLFKLSMIVLIMFVSSCKKSDDDAPKEWKKGSDFEGRPRSGAASFSIDDVVYVMGGFDGDERLNDLWYYNAKSANWFRVAGAAFPGKARNFAMAFSLNGKGYIGGGFDGTNALSDFYEFDVLEKKWKEIAKFPGEGRYGGVAFALGGKGFVGLGTNLDGDLKDFYSYSPLNNTWSQVSSLPGAKRVHAFSFMINGIAYVGSGRNNGIYLTDFWAYDVKNDKWKGLKDLKNTEKSSEYNLARENASTFVIDQKGYLVGGSSGQIQNSTWQYDSAKDSWKKFQDFGGSSRDGAIGFAVGDQGYITTGRNGSSRFDDTWVFKPNL